MSRLTFTTPPPGLGTALDYTLTGIDGVDGLYNLQAGDFPELGMFVLDSSRFVPGYHPRIPEDRMTELGLDAGTAPHLLVVARPGDDELTVNLMAPIVVNTETGLASQVILETEEYPVRAVLCTS